MSGSGQITPQTVVILGIPFNDVSFTDTAEGVRRRVVSRRPAHIATGTTVGRGAARGDEGRESGLPPGGVAQPLPRRKIDAMAPRAVTGCSPGYAATPRRRARPPATTGFLLAVGQP